LGKFCEGKEVEDRAEVVRASNEHFDLIFRLGGPLLSSAGFFFLIQPPLSIVKQVWSSKLQRETRERPFSPSTTPTIV